MINQVLSILSRLLPHIRDVVGIELGVTGTRAVRLHAERGGGISVTAAALLPPVAPPPPAAAEHEIAPLRLPTELQAWSAAVAYAFPGAIIKQLTLAAEKLNTAPYNDLLGLPRDAERRVAWRALASAEDNRDTPVVAVAVNPGEVEWIKELIPPGKPSLSVVEISGLATLTAYKRACVDPATPRCDLVVDASEHVTTLAICFKGEPLVLRTFAQGTGAVVQQIITDLGVDEVTARDILTVSSIDIRSSLRRVFEGLLRQLGMAVDFAAHRSGHRIEKAFICGSLANSHDFALELQQQVGLEPERWNPWQGMTISPKLNTGQPDGLEQSFHAATGVALGLLESD